MSPENVKVGEWLVIIRDHDAPENAIISYSGVPWQVIANSPPFLMVVSNGHMSMMDIRHLEFTKPNRRYVREFNSFCCVDDQIELTEDKKAIRIESANDKEYTCPVCLGSMRESVSSIGINLLSCTQCKFAGGMVG